MLPTTTPVLYYPARAPGMSQENLYQQLERYYFSNGLYDDVLAQAVYLSTWSPAMKSLRTPVNRSVEFYAAHLWPGSLPDALPIVAADERIIEPIAQLWQWSAWDAAKQRAARWFAMLGNMFLCNRISEDRSKTFIQAIKPSYVTHFSADYRGIIQTIRIDIPTTKGGESITHTEYYDKQEYKIWEGDHNSSDELKELGDPIQTGDLLAEYGIDFVPVTHAKFHDSGDRLGNACFVHALDKIDEVNRQATRLHQMLYRFNKATWAVTANAMDATGRPLPAPRLPSSDASGPNARREVEEQDEEIKYLPGMSKLESLVPQIAWEQALKILEAQAAELRRDLPELLFYDLETRTDLSGRAIRTLLSGAIDRCLEARGQAETALARADAIGLSIAQHLGLEGFGPAQIGSYAAGAFAHSFRTRDVIAISDGERAETTRNLTQAGMTVESAMRIAGYSEAQIEAEVKAQDKANARSQKALAAAMVNAERTFNAGGSGQEDDDQGE
jgi:hypothetical protein